ncbi:hypothetical protein SDC9_102452 [bioreactor metagenome]|uniref:TadE-like domain-containing protein n=1 Tax=bioreactor metagenome TaxID=1076179 RepID=A0A645AQV8_9ZZZZ
MKLWMKPHARRKSHAQRGIAALEFAILALFIMVPLLLGVFVFWEALQTQQVLTRATGDAARQAFRYMQTQRIRQPDGTIPTDSQMLESARINAHASISSAMSSHLGSAAGSAAEMESRISVTLQPAEEPGQVVLSVVYARPPLLGSSGQGNFLEPDQLSASSLISRN